MLSSVLKGLEGFCTGWMGFYSLNSFWSLTIVCQIFSLIDSFSRYSIISSLIMSFNVFLLTSYCDALLLNWHYKDSGTGFFYSLAVSFKSLIVIREVEF